MPTQPDGSDSHTDGTAPDYSGLAPDCSLYRPSSPIFTWSTADPVQPTGLMAQLSLTYASQRVSGLKVTVAIYSGVCPVPGPCTHFIIGGGSFGSS